MYKMKTTFYFLILFFTTNYFQVKSQNVSTLNDNDYYNNLSNIISAASKKIDIKFFIKDTAEKIITVVFNFPFSKKALSIFEETLNADSTLKCFTSEYKNNESTFIFENVKLKYNQENNSFISDSIIYISSLNGHFINKSIFGYIEFIQYNTENSQMNIFLQGDNYNYYFRYCNGIMETFSSVEKYDLIIYKTPVYKRYYKRKGYQYHMSSERRAKEFLHRISPETLFK